MFLQQLFNRKKEDPMKYLIVGLGNPGEKYAHTRHNIGFDVLDEFAFEREAKFETAKLGDLATAKWKGRTILLLKPSTFMNLSGKAVNYYLQKEKIPVERLLVITDDIALSFGKLRMKGKGSDGGHNGLKHIQATLGTQEYARLRFGVGSDFNKGQQVDYVLGKWDPSEHDQLQERIKVCANFIKDFTTIGLQKTIDRKSVV